MSWREFIEDSDGRGSASRLNMMIGVLVGSFVVIWLTIKGTLGGEIFATFMLATGGVYAWGKTRESMEEVERTRAENPVAPVVVPPAASQITINAGAKPEGEANVQRD